VGIRFGLGSYPPPPEEGEERWVSMLDHFVELVPANR
jgi:hypothetical protein